MLFFKWKHIGVIAYIYRYILAWNFAGGKSDKIEAVLLQAEHEESGSLEKDNNAGKNRRQQAGR